MKTKKISISDLAKNSLLKKKVFALLQDEKRSDDQFLLTLIGPHRWWAFKNTKHETKIIRNDSDGQHHTQKEAIFIELIYDSYNVKHYDRFRISEDLDLFYVHNAEEQGTQGMIEFYTTIVDHYNACN